MIHWSNYTYPESQYSPGVNLYEFAISDIPLLKANQNPDRPIIFVRWRENNAYWIISPINAYSGSCKTYPKDSLVWCFASDVDMGSKGDAKA